VLAEVSNQLKRVPTLWRMMIRLYGVRPFNPARAKYRKKYDSDLHTNIEIADLSIIFDAQCIQTPTRKRGIGRYSISLIAAICAEKPEQKFGVLLTKLRNKNDFNVAVSELESLNCPNLQLLVHDPFRNTKSVSFHDAQKALENFLLGFNPVAVVSLSSFEKLDSIIPISKSNSFKRLVVLYDLIPLQYNRELLISNYQVTSYHWALTNLAASDCLLSISRESEATWRRLVYRDSKIKVIHGAGYGTSNPIYPELNAMRSGILCVGAEQPHKNIYNLIKAYSLLAPNVQALHELTILGIHSRGSRAKLEKLAKSFKVSINLPSHVTNLELEGLYLSNKLLVMPSLVEGLSMPILEGWQLGLPAVGSAGTVAEELILDSELLFDPIDVTSIAVTIQNVLTNESVWQRAAKSTSDQVDRFSWQITAKLVLEAVSEETKHD
jgi:glycosyltransferase involved in cell wall biosynthesis